MFDARGKERDYVRLGSAVAYGTSLLENRVRLSRKVLEFQLGVLYAAASLIQLAFGIIAVTVDTERTGWLWPAAWSLWLPAILIAGVGSVLLVRDYLRLNAEQRQDLTMWEGVIKSGGKKNDE